ncbi:MAG: cob(I)yrinic acid a,c-diamide adenosyltransferase [Candidatus Bathyarchaeia archaeon]
MIKKRKKEFGLIHVYTGDGKGKTTAALGTALRAIGWGFKVYFIQFLKRKSILKEGAFKVLNKNPNFKHKAFGAGAFIIEKPLRKDYEEARKALTFSKEVIMSKEYDLVVLDEIINAINLKLIAIEDVLDLIKNKPKNVELILTGRDAPKDLLDFADLVTEMKMVKHPFSKGVYARKGIEY